jgi:hypothetical protein
MLNRRIKASIILSTLFRILENAIIIEWNAMPQYKINKSSEACKKDVELPLLPTVLERY